jgi:hypothetical protein
MANELIVALAPTGGIFHEASSPYSAETPLLSCFNTEALTLSSLDWDINGALQSSVVSSVAQNTGAVLGNPSITVDTVYTFSVSGFSDGGGSLYTGSTTGQWLAATNPTIDFTVSPNSLTGLDAFTRTLVLASTAGSWAVDPTVTDWRINDTEYPNVSAISNMGFLSGSTYVVGMSGYDIYGNKGIVSKTLVSQSISGLADPIFAVFNTILNPSYVGAFYYVNTTNVTLSAYEYSTDGNPAGLTVHDIPPLETNYFTSTWQSVGTHTYSLTGYGSGTSDVSIVSGYIGLSAPTAPTVNITIAPNSLTGVGIFTRTVYTAATAGTWDLDLSATDWSLDGSETYNTSAMGILIPQPSVNTTHPLIMSGYDIYGNMSTKSVNIESQVISAAVIPASNYFHTIAATPAILAYGRISNTSDIALSSYNWSQNDVEGSRTSLAIASGSTELSAGTLSVTSIGTKTFVVTCWANALNDIVTAIDRCDFALPTVPTASLSCNTLSADEPFTASFVVATTAGTWAVDTAATDWDFGDGITSAAAGMSVDHSYTPDTSADSWVIRVSAYDIYSNLSNIATWNIGDTWSEADRLAEGIRKWTLGYGKGDKGVPLSEL